jgi:TRAP transporter TAXI family solute receptor
VRKLLTGVAFAVALSLATGAAAQPLGLGSSPQGTLTYSLVATIAKTLADVAKIDTRVQPQAGTGAMVPLVNSGEIDIGVCNSLELYDSFTGTGSSADHKNPNLRTVAVLFPIRVGLFVRDDSPIKSMQDLKGKRIAYGYTSQEIIKQEVDAMLASAGLSIKDMTPVMVPNLVRGVDEFVAGRVDVTTFALGQAKVAEADAAVKIRFLDLGTDKVGEQALKKVFRTAYFAEVKPAPNIPYVKEPIHTMALDYTIFANAKVPADKIKTIVGVLASHKDDLAKGMPLFNAMNPANMYKGVEVPYHDGAIAYYKENGIAEKK